VEWGFGGLNKIPDKENLFAILWQYFRESTGQKHLSLESPEAQEAFLRNVWHDNKEGFPPQRWEYQEHLRGKFSDSLPQLSYEVALEAEEGLKRLSKDRVNRLTALGNSIVPQIAFEIFMSIKENDDN